MLVPAQAQPDSLGGKKGQRVQRLTAPQCVVKTRLTHREVGLYLQLLGGDLPALACCACRQYLFTRELWPSDNLTMGSVNGVGLYQISSDLQRN